MSLCTECGVDNFVEVEMASIGVGILGTLRDKTGIMQLTIKTKMCVGCNGCCSMSSFGLDSLPQDHTISLVLLYKLLAFDALFLTHFAPSAV